MIPAAGFSLNDFFATARFAITVYSNIQLGHSAPKAYLDFRRYILDFGNGLQHLGEILQEHERHLFNSGARGTVDKTSRVQRTLSEVVGDFKTLEENTKKFLRHYKFMTPPKKSGESMAAWKKVRVYSEGTAMYKEMETLKLEYMFHTAKVNIVVEPLRFLLLSSIETTLIDVQQTVNRIEQLARSLYTQTIQEPFGVHETVPEESIPMSRESSSGSAVSPQPGSPTSRFPRRTDTGLSDASTIVSGPLGGILKRKSVYTLPGVHSGNSSGSSTAITSTSSEWVWLHEQFAAALSRSVGLEQTKLGVVLDEVIRWLEEGRRGIRSTRSGDFIDTIAFVNLCKASWLCGKLLSSHQYQTLDANSLWHPYIGKIAESIRHEFEDLKQLRLKLPNIQVMRPLPSLIFDLSLPQAIGFGRNPFDFVEQEILRMNLPGYGEMEREVTLVEVQGGDTIRVKDKIGHGTEWTVTPNTLKRSKTTLHPSIPFMQGSGLLQRPHLILKNSDDSVSVGFEFSDYTQLNVFQAALTGYKIVSQLKQVGKVECYYHSSKLHRAKMDVYDQTSVQLWHEKRAHAVLPRSRQPSAYSSTSNSGGKSLLAPLFETQPQDTTRAFRTHSRNSVTAGSISATTSSTSSSMSSSKGSHTVKTQEAKVEQSPESSKLVIFARPDKGTSRGDVGSVEILVMEIDPYTMISREACCTAIKPDPKGEDSPLCCLRVVIEKLGVGGANDGKSLRLLGFREPEQDSRREDSRASGGPLGPGLPLNVDAWPEKRSRSRKAQGLAIRFNTDLDKRLFIKDFEDLHLLALSSAGTYR